jgi:hypothetical protein
MPEDSSQTANENDDDSDYDFPFLNDARLGNNWLQIGVDEMHGARLVGATSGADRYTVFKNYPT